MTLGDFLNVCSANESIVLFYFLALPLTALLAWVFGKGQGHESPWKYLYSALVYLACIPGIFAITLSVFLLLFERNGSILDANMHTQILPVISMFATLWLIRRNVDFDFIPGFGKITTLVLLLTALIALFWILERTHIFVISIMPIEYFIALFVVILVILRFGMKKLLA